MILIPIPHQVAEVLLAGTMPFKRVERDLRDGNLPAAALTLGFLERDADTGLLEGAADLEHGAVRGARAQCRAEL